MIEGIMGRKLGMSRVFRENGRAEAATAIEAGPCVVVQVKTEAKEGYNAAQVGFGQARQVKSPQEGHLKKLGQFKYLREFRVADTKDIAVGDQVTAALFKTGDLVEVSGISKGRGFAGTVKRHGFAGGPKTHGQSDRHRAPGSIGAGSSPGRVWKGTRMSGHMGHVLVKVRRLEVLSADAEKNLLVLKGAVPGAKNGLLIIRKSGG
jgi:large subunit ribosomal protein L3